MKEYNKKVLITCLMGIIEDRDSKKMGIITVDQDKYDCINNFIKHFENTLNDNYLIKSLKEIVIHNTSKNYIFNTKQIKELIKYIETNIS